MATKERRKAPPRAPKYHRLTEEKRIIIETLRKEGYSNRQIMQSNRGGRRGLLKGKEYQRERRRAPTLARPTSFWALDGQTQIHNSMFFSPIKLSLMPFTYARRSLKLE